MRILIVGSGPSGVHFALTVLGKNHTVTMLDVGGQKPPSVLPEEDFIGLKSKLADPAGSFLGAGFHAIDLPEPGRKEYYNLPPSKEYVFRRPDAFAVEEDGLTPLVSFAAGGLAECWTGGSYPFNEEELREFSFSYSDIVPHYAEVAARIGVAGAADDLSEYIPVHDHLAPMLKLDESASRLLATYNDRRQFLTSKYNARLGRSRQAVLSKRLNDRQPCAYCGRCLWGCPNGAFYTPSLTLRQCLAYRNFEYVPNAFASHMQIAPSGSIESLISYDLGSGLQTRRSADAYILACGAINTSNIFLRSIYKSRKEIIRLNGLMDNRQILAPLCNLSMLGRGYDPRTYQYHQLAFGIEGESPDRYVHGQITTLKTATAHPIFRNLPFDLRSSIGVFRALRSSLAVLNLNFCDWRREQNFLTLSKNAKDANGWPALSIRYRPAVGERETLRKACATARGFFREIGAPFIPGMMRIRPMGSSVHYAGTLPMSGHKRPWAVSPTCQSYDIDNLFVVDGAAFPFLPAKNLTFTLMANAVRVASVAF